MEEIYKIEIPLKLPSCNDYINQCRRNKYAGAELKRKTEENIIQYLDQLPKFEKAVKIDFLWIEENKRRDLDRHMLCKEIHTRCISKGWKAKR